jgi:hypothetical protein
MRRYEVMRSMCEEMGSGSVGRWCVVDNCGTAVIIDDCYNNALNC